MSGRILQLATFDIHAGKLEAFKASIRSAIAFTETHGPQVFASVYLDEPRLRAYSIQIQRNADAIVQHWQRAQAQIAEVMQHCTLAELELYGEPDERVAARMRELERDGVRVRVAPHFAGFARCPFLR